MVSSPIIIIIINDSYDSIVRILIIVIIFIIMCYNRIPGVIRYSFVILLIDNHFINLIGHIWFVFNIMRYNNFVFFKIFLTWLIINKGHCYTFALVIPSCSCHYPWGQKRIIETMNSMVHPIRSFWQKFVIYLFSNL